MIFPQYTVAISSSINNNLLKSTFLSKSSIRQINLGIVIPSEPKIISREVTLGFLGRLIEEKGIFNLLDAVKMLETDKIMFKLIIRGKGETDKIMRFIKSGQMENYVSLSPSLYEENEVYKGIDVLVLPSMLNEGLPLSILEAAVRRILIVTTGAGGIGDFIVNQVTGITLVSTSPEQIAATLKEAILNYNNYESILENSYVKAKNEFSLEQMTTKYEQFYSTVINSNSID
jgi:glycosyltransferase involved in cell wall biosynthesis